MAAQLWIHTIVVEGNLTFPLDMLRYDRVSPSTSQDIEKVFPDHELPVTERFATRRVVLIAFNTKLWSPTADRWRSFGWRVVSHTKRAWN